MLHGDLDDDQGPRFTLKHPPDRDSASSSPSSAAPTFYDTRRASKTASRRRSHTTTDASTSSHLLARLVSREEEVREINAVLAVTTERLETESSRANAAERRALDYFHRLRIATDSRERSEQECARLREELKMYKLQLENAQKEIFRAQDIIDQVAAQRNEAEAVATRARTKARKLQEEKLVMIAHEEGRKAGYREGLTMGRRISYDQDNYYDGDENMPERLEHFSDEDEERDDPRSRIQLRSAGSIRHLPTRPDSPPVRTLDAAPPLPIPSPITPVRVHTPSHGHRTPSPPHAPNEPETIHPIPIHLSPVTPTQHINPPPDGWISRADSRTSYIPVPPPHGFQQAVPSSPSSVADELEDHRPTPQPKPVPPPIRSRDYAYQTFVPPPVQRMPSLTSRTSTQISQYDLVNKRPGSSLRNEIYIDRAGSGSRSSGGSTSRNEYREDRRRSDRTEAESIAEQWRADSDTATPPPRVPRASTPRRPVNFYYQPQVPADDKVDPRRTPVPTETSARSHALEDPASLPTRVRSPIDYLRQRFRQRNSSGSGGSIPNIVVEPPSDPEMTLSPSGSVAGQPELLSPEAASRPLPQDDFQSQSQSQPPPPPQSRSQSRSQSYSQPPSQPYYASSSSHDTGSAFPAGFVPYPPAPAPVSEPKTRPSAGRREEYERAASASASASQHAHGRTRAQSTSVYEAAPLPPGVVYPAPPTRPHTSHMRREREGGREREWEWERREEKERDRDRKDRVRDRHREKGVREKGRARGGDERERERDGYGHGDWEGDGKERRSPAPLARPISLFDSDEE